MHLHYLMSTKKVIKDLYPSIHRYEASFRSHGILIFYRYLGDNNGNVFGETHVSGIIFLDIYIM